MRTTTRGKLRDGTRTATFKAAAGCRCTCP